MIPRRAVKTIQRAVRKGGKHRRTDGVRAQRIPGFVPAHAFSRWFD